MLESDERVFFQTKISKGLLGKFRNIQEKRGRTARSLTEELFIQLVEEDDRKEIELGRQSWQR